MCCISATASVTCCKRLSGYESCRHVQGARGVAVAEHHEQPGSHAILPEASIGKGSVGPQPGQICLLRRMLQDGG